VIPSAACAAPSLDIGNDEEGVAVVDRYDREYEWTAPDACRIYLDQRVTDQDARIVEYAAELDGEPLSVVYWFDEAALLPVRVDVIARAGRTLSAELDAEHLVVRGADGEIALEVTGYGRGPAETVIDAVAPLDEDSLLALSQCALPLRTELGPVPPFLHNLDVPGRLGDDPDVSQGSSEAPPILDWDGPVSVLGALLLQAACTQSDGWACPCLEWSELTRVEGWCG
jgi:hypothetical protein